MNAQHFLEWFEHSLIPQLPPNSIIVMDNAKYHNTVVEKIPTMSSLKKVMQTWLDINRVTYESTDLKKDLLKKIQQTNAKTVYKTDPIADKHGHKLLRLPIAHCELNPIELAWAIMNEFCR